MYILKPLTFSFVLLLSLFSEGPIALADKIKPFTSDGCSLFPDGNLENKQLWLRCCEEHDYSYWQGGTKNQRAEADKALRFCVSAVGEPEIAALMLAGVRVGGSPYWPSKFRWAYGWPYFRGYKALSDDERLQITQSNRGEID